MAGDQVSDDEFAQEGVIVATDPDTHVERIRELEQLGPTIVCLQLIGSADPHGAIRIYGDTVLPELRGTRVA